MYNYSQLYIYNLLIVYTPDLMGEITIFQLQFQNHSRLIFYALHPIFYALLFFISSKKLILQLKSFFFFQP